MSKKIPWTQERFLARIDTSGGPDACWPWLGANDGRVGGYGRVGIGGRTMQAHRLAYRLFIDEGLAAEDDVRHTCDNPPCCNPRHLIAGSTAENIHDCEAKRRARHPRGSAHGRAKLTDDDVQTIRQLLAERVSLSRLARQYGLSKPAIMAIRDRKTWKHLP